MKKQALAICAAALISGGLLAGCSSAQDAQPEITSTAPEVEKLIASAQATGWADAASQFEALDAQAQTEAKAITKENAKEQVLARVDTIVDNIPAIETAVKSGSITSEAETAAKDVYLAAQTLKQLGDYSGQDVSLYIMDIADDALCMLQNAYDGLVANVDARQSECDVNRDRILAFTDKEWQEFANKL